MRILTLARDLTRRKARERSGLFVAEGIRTVEELLASPLRMSAYHALFMALTAAVVWNVAGRSELAFVDLACRCQNGALDLGADALDLHRTGLLALLHAHMISLRNMRRLAEGQAAYTALVATARTRAR